MRQGDTMDTTGGVECPNCGSTLERTALVCQRCGETTTTPGGGTPRFTETARNTGVWLGGLLNLHPSPGERVKFVGRCPAGAFALDAHGEVVWVLDWGYVGEFTLRDKELWIDGRRIDLETGTLAGASAP